MKRFEAQSGERLKKEKFPSREIKKTNVKKSRCVCVCVKKKQAGCRIEESSWIPADFDLLLRVRARRAALPYEFEFLSPSARDVDLCARHPIGNHPLLMRHTELYKTSPSAHMQRAYLSNPNDKLFCLETRGAQCVQSSRRSQIVSISSPLVNNI